MINPNNELLRWGPIDGKPFYIHPFVLAFVEYPKFMDHTWPDTLGFFKDDKVFFVVDYSKLRNVGERLFIKYAMDDKKIKEQYNKWMKTVNRLKEWENVINQGIPKDKLKDYYNKWREAHINFWMTGFFPELSNWGGEQLLKRKIIEFNKINFIDIFEGLSAPEDLSFFQTEELELMKIKLIDDEKKQLERLREHQKRYYWLRNSYAFTEVLDIDFFKNELDKVSKNDAKKKIEEINNYISKIKKRKKDIIKKYNISDEIVKIARKLAYCIWWQDFRKQFIFIVNHMGTMFMKEIEKVKGIPFRELCYYCEHEVVHLLENNKKTDTKQRFNGFTMYYHEGNGITYKTGKEACDLIRPYIEVKVDKDMKEFKGMVVSRGDIVKGKVKILLTPKNLKKMQKGDILVAPMTSPDYIVAMRKASAIITDAGGMTCHAAIVSRELGIPCIVATNIASKLLKDNDLVEVDADKGIVRRLK